MQNWVLFTSLLPRGRQKIQESDSSSFHFSLLNIREEVYKRYMLLIIIMIASRHLDYSDGRLDLKHLNESVKYDRAQYSITLEITVSWTV
jgi:hypothetical protein